MKIPYEKAFTDSDNNLYLLSFNIKLISYSDIPVPMFLIVFLR